MYSPLYRLEQEFQRQELKLSRQKIRTPKIVGVLISCEGTLDYISEIWEERCIVKVTH